MILTSTSPVAAGAEGTAAEVGVASVEEETRVRRGERSKDMTQSSHFSCHMSLS